MLADGGRRESAGGGGGQEATEAQLALKDQTIRQLEAELRHEKAEAERLRRRLKQEGEARGEEAAQLKGQLARARGHLEDEKTRSGDLHQLVSRQGSDMGAEAAELARLRGLVSALQEQVIGHLQSIFSLCGM